MSSDILISNFYLIWRLKRQCVPVIGMNKDVFLYERAVNSFRVMHRNIHFNFVFFTSANCSDQWNRAHSL